MGVAARKKKPRTSHHVEKKKGNQRPVRKKGTNLRLVKDEGFVIEVHWSPSSMKQLQRKVYHLRMAHEWTQEYLAEKAGLHKGTIIRYEDLERPMLAPRLKTFLCIFKAFGAKVNVTYE